MEDTIKIRKDRIKTVAIIFLSVMLILTFFSNSILNFSLPEVATQTITQGTISEKVRGTGTVTASDPYKVVLSESRVIKSVAVKKGDEVKKDQTLFVLEDKESDELIKAEAELDALVFTFGQKILSGELTASSFQDAQNGKDYTISQYQARIQAANDKVTTLQKTLDSQTNTVNSIQKQIDLLANKVVDTSSEQDAVDQATKDLASANEELTTASNEVAKLKDLILSISGNDSQVEAWQIQLKAAIEKETAKQNKVAACTKNLSDANTALSRVQNTNSASVSKAELSNQLVEATAAMKATTTALETAKTEQATIVKNIQTELDLGNQNTLIADKEEEVAKLKEKSTGATIQSPVAGTISEITKTAGETTVPDEAVATIQVAGKGFTVSFSVTNDQAKKVSVGDVAELQNAWYYEDVKAVLSKIKPDTEDPGKKKQLVFQVEGSISDGESLSLSIGQKTADYDMVVPNSAVREDKNGKFILTIEEKTTPFGNRYKAKRYDVEVLASDDKQTAVQGEMQGYEYVITTSNKPVESGDQVRLAEN